MGWIHTSIRFAREAYIELKNCTWLSRKQVALSTWAVILLVFAIAIFMTIVDKMLSFFFQMVI